MRAAFVPEHGAPEVVVGSGALWRLGCIVMARQEYGVTGTPLPCVSVSTRVVQE